MTDAVSNWKNYALALALFALALSLRLLLLPVEAGLPYLTFYPGVVIGALLCGWRATLLFIALSASIGTYIFLPLHFSFVIADIVPVFAFLVSALTMLAAIEVIQRRAGQALQAKDEVRRLTLQQLTTRTDDLQARLQLAARSSNTGFWDWDLRSNEVYYSPEWKSQLGYSDHELTNQFREWESRVHPDDLADALQRVQTYIAAPTGDFEMEFRMRHRDGSYRWILARGQVQLDPKGKPIRMLGSHVDITERKQAEDGLRESKELLHLFIEHAPVALAMFDREMRYLAVSRQWISDYFLSDQDIIGRSHYEVFPEISENWKTVHRRGLAGESIREDEDRFDRNDGTVQWLRWGVIPWRTADGAIGGIIIFSEDISEKKQIQEALRTSEQKYSILFHTATFPTAIARFDNFRIIDVNDAFIKLFGYSKDELIGKTSLEIGLGRDPAKREQVLSEVKANRDTKNFELTYFSKSGKAHIVSVNSQRIDISGHECVISTLQDITEQKQSMEKIAAQLDELMRWQKLTLGREGRVIELKFEVNKLLAAQGQPPRYGDLT